MIKSFIIILFLCVSSFAQSDSVQEHRIDTELNQCLDSNLSTQGMLKCIYEADEKWESEMTRYLNLFSALLSDTARKKLIKSQAVWEDYRKNEMENITEIYKMKDGTMYQIMMADDVMQLTRNRARDLIDYYELLIMK